MGNILDSADRESLRRRLARLQPEARARWGSMTPHQMVCHQLDAFKVYRGEKAVDVHWSMRAKLRLAKPLVLYRPWPKGKIDAPPDLFETQPGYWTQDVKRLDEFIRLMAVPPHPWPEHPFLGQLTSQEWGLFVYRHVDHHLTQFGV